MDPFTMYAIGSIASTGLSVLGSFGAAKTAKLEAGVNVANMEAQKAVSEAEARQRSADRMEMYNSNLSANIAQFAAQGRDVGSDRSVKAFLERQKEIAGQDIGRSAFMGGIESMRRSSEAYAEQARGAGQARAYTMQAFTTAASGLQRYYETKI